MDTDHRDAMHDLHAELAAHSHALFSFKRNSTSAFSSDVCGNIIAPGAYWTDAHGWSREARD